MGDSTRGFNKLLRLLLNFSFPKRLEALAFLVGVVDITIAGGVAS